MRTEDLAQNCVYGLAIGLSLCLTVHYSHSLSTILGRRVYPISIYDDSDIIGINNFGGEPYFCPNLGLRIDKVEYEQLSLIRKISNAVLMIASGAFTGAITAVSVTGLIAYAMKNPNPNYLISISVICCSVLGAGFAVLHDPKIGNPFIRSLGT
jgi:hypothetical protein